MFPRPSSKRRSGSQGSGGGAAESKVEAAGSLAGLGRSRQVALLLVAEAQRCSAFNSPSRGNFASIPACLLKRCHGVRSPLRRSRLRCKRRAGRLLCWVRRQLGLAGNFDWILINAESLWVRRGSLIDLGMSVQLGPDAKKKRSCVESALAPVPLSLSLCPLQPQSADRPTSYRLPFSQAQRAPPQLPAPAHLYRPVFRPPPPHLSHYHSSLSLHHIKVSMAPFPAYSTTPLRTFGCFSAAMSRSCRNVDTENCDGCDWYEHRCNEHSSLMRIFTL
jgi:hypothetical protein